MGLLQGFDKIDENTDFLYNGSDSQCFPACNLCMSYSPFLFYVTSTNALESLKQFLGSKLNIFCAECLPQRAEHRKSVDEPFYEMECLFNSEQFISLCSGYRYSNPYYAPYRAVERLIITENAKIDPKFKQLLRKPLPRVVKIGMIQDLFPSVHRMRFKKYANMLAVLEAVQNKVREIWHFYSNTSISALHDNYDVLAERTPLQFGRKPQRRSVSDSLVLRSTVSSDDSVGQVNTIPMSENSLSLEISRESIPVRDETTVNTQGGSASQPNTSTSQPRQNTISQSFEPDISLQSVQPYVSSQSADLILENSVLSESMQTEVPVPAMPTVSIPEPSLSSSVSSDSEPLANRITVVAKRKAGVVFHDSQEAGPSGLQNKQSGAIEPASKRRRVPEIPMNPAPNEFNRIRQGARMPRLQGG